jgi:hypothetical protein
MTEASEDCGQLVLLLELRAQIRAHAEQNPDTLPRQLAEALTAGFGEQELRVLAQAYVEDVADWAQRLQVRKAEDRAERSREVPVVQVAPEEQEAVAAILTESRFKKTCEQAVREIRAARKAEESRNCQWETLRDNSEEYARNPLLGLGRRKEREEFQAWMGDDFPFWLETVLAAAEQYGDSRVHSIASDWHPAGPTEYWRLLRVEQVTEMVHKVAAQVRLETTEELLSSVFALGDGGERVTWGDATTEQHQRRIELLVGNAAGNVETAARHQAAIRMIQEVGAETLREAARRAQVGLASIPLASPAGTLATRL